MKKKIQSSHITKCEQYILDCIYRWVKKCPVRQETVEQGMVAKINKIDKIVSFPSRFEWQCRLDIIFSIKDLNVILNEYLQVERQMSCKWKEKILQLLT